MRNFIDIIDSLSESWEPDWSSVRVYELPKSINLYHTTKGDRPIISTKTDRLIPKSISAKARYPDYLWGTKAFKFKIPPGTKIAEVKSIWNLLPDDEVDSPINIGKKLSKWAKSNRIQILKIGGVHQVGTEWAILDPKLIREYHILP